MEDKCFSGLHKKNAIKFNIGSVFRKIFIVVGTYLALKATEHIPSHQYKHNFFIDIELIDVVEEVVYLNTNCGYSRDKTKLSA